MHFQPPKTLSHGVTLNASAGVYRGMSDNHNYTYTHSLLNSLMYTISN